MLQVHHTVHFTLHTNATTLQPSMARQPPVGQGLLIAKASRLHSRHTTHSVRLTRTRNHPEAETRETSMPLGFEAAISVDEWPQTHALERAANGIVDLYFTVPNYTAITNNVS